MTENRMSQVAEMQGVKLPWKPKQGEEIFVICRLKNGNIITAVDKWEEDNLDYFVFYKLGFVCKTKEEANAVLPRAEKFFSNCDVINWEDNQ